MHTCMYASIKLTKKTSINSTYMRFIFTMNVFIIYFYILLKMADPDCYDLVSRSKIKPSTTTDSTTTVEEPDMGQEHVKYD